MPDALRALLVDDERLARRELRTLLGAHPEVEIVGEAADADAAEALLTSLRAEGAAPDVVFLDVQMPGRSGFDLLDGPDDRVFVKDGDRMHLVRLGDVRLFESVGNYTALHFDGPDGRPQRPLVHRSLSALEDRLDASHFARANRAEMVGLVHVVGLDDALTGGLLVRLDDGSTVEFSRRRAQTLRDRLSL